MGVAMLGLLPSARSNRERVVLVAVSVAVPVLLTAPFLIADSSSTTNALSSVAASGAAVWAVGDNATVFRSANGGEIDRVQPGYPADHHQVLRMPWP